MINCPRCGYRNDLGSRFCANCGCAVTPGGSPAGAASYPAQALATPPSPGWGGAPAWAQPAPDVQYGYPGGPPPMPAPPRYPATPADSATAPQPPPWGAVPSGRRHDPAAFDSTVRPNSEAGFAGAYLPPPQVVSVVAMPERAATPAYPQPRVSPDAFPGAPSASRVLAGFLVSFDGNPSGVFWPLYQGFNEIGRLDAALGLHIEIDHPTTSSHHARIIATPHPGYLKIEDLGSTNGTFVNNQRIEPGQRVDLNDGDSIRFGGFNTIAKVVTV